MCEDGAVDPSLDPVPAGDPPPSEAGRRAPRGSGLLWAVMGLEAGLHALDLVLGPWARMHWEELFNARAGVQLACGHLDAVDALQYRTFCGGCTAEAVVAAPLFLGLGPTVLVWKALISAIHLAILALGATVLRRLISMRAAVAFLLVMAGGPGWYLELSHTGWGNHLESTLFPLGALVVLWGVQHLGAPVRLGGVLAAGGIAGLGLWFGQTSAWALPALGLAAVWVGRWGAPLFGLGLAAGMAPWFAYYRDKPGATDATLDWWTGRELASPGAMWDWLAGPWLREHVWDPTLFGPSGSGPGVYWAVLWGLAMVGLGRLVVQLLWGKERPDRVLGWFLPLGLLTLLVVYWLRYDLWSNLPDPYVNGAFNLRYRTPLVPLLAGGAAVAVGWPWSRRGLRTTTLVLGLGLALYGLQRRVGLWGTPNLAAVGRGVYQHDGWPDKTVPLGQPPQPLRREQGRPVDIRAAQSFLADHRDALEDCRLDHAYELGRRLGLRAAVGVDADLADVLEGALPALRSPSDRALAVQGIGRGLVKDSGEQVAHLSAVLDLLDRLEPGLGGEVGHAAGARTHAAFHPDQDALTAETVDPRLLSGVCEGRGAALLWNLSLEGGRPPDRLPRERLPALLGTCPIDGGVAVGVAHRWASVGGCGAAGEAALAEWLGAPLSRAARDRLQQSCGWLRR